MSRSVGVAAPFRPCLNPATLSGVDLPDFLALAAAGGFTAVELSIQQVQALGAARVRDLLAEHGLTVAAASGILPAGPVLPAPLLVDSAAYDEHLRTLPTRLTTFAALGCPVATTVLNPYSSLRQSESLALARTRIAQLADTAADYGVRLAVEAVSITDGLPPELDGPHPVAVTLPAVAELLHDSGTANAAVLVDSFHWAVAGADPGHITALGTGGVGHVQIADVPHTGTARGWTDGLRLFPGDGALRWSVFADALHRVGYHGPASVELFNPVLRALPEDEIAARSHRAATGCWPPREAAR
ncbi:Sugar phosphate isomerase/epimerase [Parafrankia irregularis]|uniref:Sugar phosphate isomerase/epimerase n=1 Tax=Parafrankia irregularis TaxID=795642 RepID=A0A0S4R0F6_9ACTN|nr:MULTISPECIES: sugar phosphate isomerase/epimerase family protein [Parafrankia]MBE3206632.1 sugar phosphate isomerase/epimerase [Parafrankia sp. CH37]CUU61219.1 Sugar phosphate isomerase/epimerase [Parafrankia irregularis]